MNSIASIATGNNGERGTGLFALPSEISIPLSSYHAAKVRKNHCRGNREVTHDDYIYTEKIKRQSVHIVPRYSSITSSNDISNHRRYNYI